MRLNLKSKLIFLTTIPFVVILILSIGRIVYDKDVKKKFELTKQHIVEVIALSRIIHFMQIERGVSAGYVANNDTNAKETLLRAREELDKATIYVKSVYSFVGMENIDFLYILDDIKLKRKKIDTFDMSALEIKNYYTKHIETFLDFVKSIPTIIDDRENRNFIQAYSYLAVSKESLGQIRATLNEVFIINKFSDENFIFVNELLNNYKNSTDRFKKTLFSSNEIMSYYRKTFKGDAIEETFKMIDTALKEKNSTDFSVNPSYWFEQVTKTIDLLREIEDKLFITLDKSINEKINSLNLSIMLIIFSLFLMFAALLFFTKTAVRKILSLTDSFNEEFEESLILLEQYKATVDSSFIVSKTNPKGIIKYVNDEFCKASGYTREELVGKPHNIIRHPDMPKEVFKEMWHTIKELKKPWSGEVKNRAKDGSAYWMRAFIKPIIDKEGNVIEYIAMRTNITEIQEEKERIRNTLGIAVSDYIEARHLATEYENAMSATWSIIRTDINNIIKYINETFSKLSGYKPEELVGVNCSELRDKKHINNKDCENLKNALERKEIVKMQFENIAKDGSSYFVDATVIPIADSKGVVVEHLHLMCNITELVQLHIEIEKTQQEIICRMGEICESRSKETGNHIRRVAEYSRVLALKAGFDEKEADLIANASPMHDIGKVAIPDIVLLKPGAFTDDEWQIMRSHCEIGHKVLNGSQRPLLNAAAIIAKEHHEKYDGSGYPNKISGEDIHIYARIIAIADVFDALGSDRVYKKAWELEKILKLFEEEKGKHFDPRLATKFLENIEEFLKIRDKYSYNIK